MAKVARVTGFMPVTFYPKLKQYRSGITFKGIDGVNVTIEQVGYTPSSKEEQEYIERIIAKDPYCGIARSGQQEMSGDAKVSVTENIRLKHENSQQAAELKEMRERLALLEAAKA